MINTRNLIISTIAFLLPIVLYLPFYFFKWSFRFLGLFEINADFFINIYPLFVVFLIAWKYGFSSENRQLNKRADSKSNYAKPLLYIGTIAFTIIAFIIAIETNIVAEYNKNTTASDDFKWFKATEILTFPIAQYKLREKQGNQIISPNSEKRNYDMHLFVVDKTLSLKQKNYSRQNKKINDYLTKEIHNNYCDAAIDSFSIVDKTLIYLVNNVYHRQHKNVAILFYNGKNNSNLPPLETIYSEFIFDSTSKMDDILDCYKKALAKQKSVKDQKTQIDTMIYLIKEELVNRKNGNWIAKYPNKNINLHILSDFNDDDLRATRKQHYHKNISELFTQISKLSIIEFPTYSNTKSGKITKELFEDVCKECSIEDMSYSVVTLEHPDEDFEIISSELESDVRDETPPKELNFYYPYTKNIATAVPECVLKFDSNLNKAMKGNKLFIKCSCVNPGINDVVNLRLEETVTKEYKTLLYSYHDIYEVKNDNIKCSIFSNCLLNDKKVLLDVIDKSTFTKQSYKINFMPILPGNTSLYLVLFYSIFIFSFSLLIILSSYIHSHSPLDSFGVLNTQMSNSNEFKKNEMRHYYSKVLYAFSLGVSISFLVWYMCMLLSAGFNTWAVITLVIMLFLLFFLALKNSFLAALREYKRGINRDYQTLLKNLPNKKKTN